MVKENSSIWKNIKGKLSLVPPGATPPNWKTIGLMFMSLFGSAFGLVFLFPFLPEMILSFGYTEEEKGYYAGLVASSVFAGRALSNYLWGYLSDIKGRKLVLLISILLNGLFCFAFGFSKNLVMALVFRFCAGACNGIIGTVKTVLYEISDDTNQAVCMSVLSLSWGMGLIVGPSVGGWLASPNKKYPDVFGDNWFFEMFPYILPGSFCFLWSFISFAVVYFQFEETYQLKNTVTIIDDPNESEESKFLSAGDYPQNKSVHSLRSAHFSAISCEDLHCEVEAGTFLAQEKLRKEELARSFENLRRYTANHNITITVTDENSDIILMEKPPKIDKNDTKVTKNDNHAVDDSCKQITEKTQLTENVVKDEQRSFSMCYRVCTPMGILREPNVRNSILMYTIYSFAVIGFEDVFTIWASTERRLDGLEFNTSEIGTCMGAVAIPLLILQIKFYPLIVSKLGVIQTFIIFNIVSLVCVQIMPTLHLLQSEQKSTLWALVIILLLAQKLGATCCFSGSAILINNSCLPSVVGTANGIAMTSTALARTLAPTIGGSMFAWSVSNSLGPPFDVNLAFVLMGLVLTFSGIFSIMLPKSLNKQRKAV
ncbi:hypothetical protein LOTGIDRAFT_175151 [Lottia gigantea]|uniref:Major facilitator superfamily (MFS) profile domain-containing protein n=1 Tax=Lottia gigantea TaxID=225164 RepID=V4C244_LOTGI|nr:hypothetical protein LOTGIDRAFT_175151 [Lottia gigantea]ESO95559.1 hypothetical protein LOTGIDRAFT_175151 [Lottia gigantea]